MNTIRIVHRHNGSVLWEGPAATMKDAIHAAFAAQAHLLGADLSGAHLSGANLSGAHLSGADLSGAHLSGADLSWAHLSRANLSGAHLSGADLSGAHLSGADLSWANLSGADLSRAHLSWAHLSGANLSGADLSRAHLSWATGVVPERSTPLLMLLDQPGPIRAYKLVTADGRSPFHHHKLSYAVGDVVTVDDANTNPAEQCAAGISVASLDWCLANWTAGCRVFVVEFLAADIAAIPTCTDGKFRLHRCAVVGEKDLTALVPTVEMAAAAS